MKKNFTIKEVGKTAKTLNVDTKKIPLKKLQQGMNVELEHRNITKGSPILSAKIALAHLHEYSGYYYGLKKMENSLNKNKNKK